MPLPSPCPSSHGKANTGAEEAASPAHSPSKNHVSTKIPESHQALRARSNTTPHRHLSATFSSRLRARTSPQFQKPPLHLDLPSTATRLSPTPETPPTLPESPLEKPSAPIDIPARKKVQGHPTTPLTARAPQGEYFTSWNKTKPRISESLTPYYSSRANKASDIRDPSAAQRVYAQMNRRPKSSPYRPSSPLSPNMSLPLPSMNSSQSARAVQSLNLAGLPKYHPANFPSRDFNPTPASPISSRSSASQAHSSHGSDAKEQLVRYRRNLVNNQAKISRSLLSSNVSSKPTLNPLGSPTGPMTPFMLEGATD
ncbi:hypothetical protein IMSHALPRED_000421 [Imshaugia aleurites]|uniref:Uncharacterized protein n=1 Tax=Imshaugia aleurites TaxID=172621 RepID=A0A8H3EWP1_9LECA|nr:hypothetical protein IMSHALPRED_000421 [Imshaugia aleurites]